MNTLVLTVHGRKIDLLAPRPEDIYWPDVCFALANINRFTGHTTIPVAQHSVIVCDLVADFAKPHALIHDAKEYIKGDDSTPKQEAEEIAFFEQFPPAIRDMLRKSFPNLKMGREIIEERVDAAIHAAAGLQWPVPPEIEAEIKRFDLVSLATESRDNLPEQVGDPSIQPITLTIKPMPATDAQHLFANRLQVMLPTLNDVLAA